MGRLLFRCTQCDLETSITAGTLFQDTRKPLRLWFQAMWYVTNQKHVVSAIGLGQALGNWARDLMRKTCGPCAVFSRQC